MKLLLTISFLFLSVSFCFASYDEVTYTLFVYKSSTPFDHIPDRFEFNPNGTDSGFTNLLTYGYANTAQPCKVPEVVVDSDTWMVVNITPRSPSEENVILKAVSYGMCVVMQKLHIIEYMKGGSLYREPSCETFPAPPQWTSYSSRGMP